MTHIYYNGKVFTGDENLQQAFVVENKKFIYMQEIMKKLLNIKMKTLN